MSDIEPDKLKVAELRDELKARGLDTKGNKAALVARLKEALNAGSGGGEEEDVADEENEEEAEAEDQESQQNDDDDDDVQQEEDTMEADNEEEESQPATKDNKDNAEDEQANQEANGDADEEEAVVLGDEFQTIDEASQDDDGDADRKRKRSRSPRHRRSRSRDRHRRSHSRERHHPRHSPPPRKVEMEDTAWESLTTFVLDRYNADLSLRFDENHLKAHTMSTDGFSYMWSGVRAMFGVTSGKVAFEVKVLENMRTDHMRDETTPHELIVGWSTDSTNLNLGEEELSFGYGGSSKKCNGDNFEDYGEKFGKGDVITAYLDFESSPAVISYSKNGEDLGDCFEVETEKLADVTLFPHLMSKNIEFECNFGALEEPWFALKEGFVFLETIDQESRVRGPAPPATKEECQIIMMVGLPGAGKSHWAVKHVSDNPEKRFTLLGTKTVIDKMKVLGKPRKEIFKGRWDIMLDKASRCLNRLIEIAARKKRNYIIDQTNVYASARRRKMQPFEGFQRKAIVVLPTDEEFKNRVKQRTEDERKEIPESAVLEMKANFTLPEPGQCFEEVEYTEAEPAEDEREKLIEKYRKEGRDALPPPEKRFRRDNRFDNRDSRGDRRGGYRGYDRDRQFRGRGGGFNSWRSYNDRRGGGGGFRGGYRDDRRRDDRRDSGYKGRGGGWRGGWNQGGGWGGSYSSGWGRGGYGGGWGGGYGSSYNQGWGGGYGGYGYR